MNQDQSQNHVAVQAILFDADGVVIFPNRFARYLEQKLNLTPDVTRQFFEGVFLECLVGQADLKEALVPFLPRWGWRSSTEEFLKRWFDEENAVDQRMIKVVAQLRRQGFFCGLATNQERYRLDYMKTQMGFSILFDAIFSSVDISALKNDPRYFERVTTLLDLPKERILLWDDSHKNVEAARVFGWKAEHFTTFESFLETLPQYVV